MAEFLGDANNDGRINSLDIPIGMRVVSGIEHVTENDNERMDVNGDGSATLTDVLEIIDHINCVNLIDEVIY